ncbi:MAG: hypothetical protein KKD01_01090 [Proteobacteria bacterium]|nr:hypothetical protein [Pseudomonadota bacterium]MBU1140101.1 hypothetical protein [Pseudomonadota bacterium]MBU1231543.1 hypothetical protein [Pseudomonadota bacterium]MBU1418110.1 hypothetical protein [Pseudomonadota bacterium]MBU1453294.1 hypothetical protein [Pseudomonadota bacterium]
MIGQISAQAPLAAGSQVRQSYENSAPDRQEDSSEVTQQSSTSFSSDVTSLSPQALALARNVPPVGNQAESNGALSADSGNKDSFLPSGQINIMA